MLLESGEKYGFPQGFCIVCCLSFYMVGTETAAEKTQPLARLGSQLRIQSFMGYPDLSDLKKWLFHYQQGLFTVITFLVFSNVKMLEVHFPSSSREDRILCRIWILERFVSP